MGIKCIIPQVFIKLEETHDSFKGLVSCTVFFQFGILLKLAWPIKFRHSESCSRLRVGKRLSEMFPVNIHSFHLCFTVCH